jgi:hypothetical protein
MGALTTKRVRVSIMNSGFYEGVVSFEGEHYLMMRDDEGVTTVFPWYSIAKVEVLRTS